MLSARIRSPEVIMVALFVCLWLVLLVATRAQGLVGLQPEELSGDPRQYSDLAVSLLRHGVYALDGRTPFFEREPGYSLFLAAVYAITGIRNVTAVYAAQAILHATAALVFARAVSQFLLRRSVLILLVFLLFFPAIWHGIFSVTRESLALSLVMLFAVSALRLRDAGRWRDALVTGTLLGALFLTYAVFLLFPLFLVLVLVLWRVRARLIVACTIACIAVMLSWGARNALHTGDLCMTGCYRAALQWHVRGEQAEHIRGFEPALCLWAEYVSRDYSGRSPYCNFNAVWHRRWPEGFVGVPEDARIAREGQRKILRNIPHYLWFSIFEVVELHLPYVNGWGTIYNLLAVAATGALYLGVVLAAPSPWRREHLLFAALTIYVTGLFALTDAIPRYLLPVIFVYMLWAGIGYDRLLRLWHR